MLASWELQDSPTESSSRGDRLLAWLFEPYQVAALLGTYSELVRSLEDPWVDTLERSRSRPTGGRFAPHLFLLPNLLDAVDKLKAIELGQLLARQALTLERRGLETGSLPRSFDDSSLDPYASGSFLYESLSDGRARLSAPAAIELWRSEHPAADGRQKPIFEWTVGSPGGS